MDENSTHLDQNKIVAEAAAKIVVELFKSTAKALARAGRYVAKQSQTYDPLGVAARAYSTRFELNHNKIKILGMHEPVALREIFTKVNILDEITSRRRYSIDELKEFVEREKDKKGFGLTSRSQDALVVANKNQKLLILGGPGSGKTTFLKHVCLSALDGKTAKKRIPVFVNLKDWADSKRELLDEIKDQFEVCGLSESASFVENLLEQGNCLIALDGLDEVPETSLNKLTRSLRTFVQKYNKNQFIISCRIAAYDYVFEDFVEAEIAQFEGKQIDNFVDNWFGKRTKRAVTCRKKIWNNASTRDLASNPLLLTMLCIAFEDNLDFPSNRAELYKDAIDALLRKWDSSRGIKRDEIYRYLSPFKKEGLFCKIAWDSFKSDNYFMQQEYLEEQIVNFLLNISDKAIRSHDIDGEHVLKAIEAQHGIFVERARKVYSFAHLSFQEFFAARYLKEQAKIADLRAIIRKHIDSDKWRETLVILVNILDDADFAIGVMASEIERRRKAPHIRPLLKNAVEYANCISVTKNRSAAFFLALTYVAFRQLGEIEDDDVDYGLLLDLRGTLKLTMAISEWFDPKVERLNSLLLTDLDTIGADTTVEIAASLVFGDAKPPRIPFAISPKYLPELKSFLKSCVLLKECLSSESYVSRKVRKMATSQMAS
ncbi:NACHT domain-containing protein [bacterium]|nr:MAG: NACHT domain-containing protein [bacterium]